MHAGVISRAQVHANILNCIHTLHVCSSQSEETLDKICECSESVLNVSDCTPHTAQDVSKCVSVTMVDFSLNKFGFTIPHTQS